MAYGKITGENVYRSAGAPSPSDMEFVLHTLLNKPFGEALQLADAMLGRTDGTITAIPDGVSVVVTQA